MRRLILIIAILLCARLEAQSLSCGLTLGYVPTNLSYLELGTFHSFAIGVPVKLDLGGAFVVLRPEAVVGTKQATNEYGSNVQYNLPSVILPLIAGYDFNHFGLYAGAKLRYGVLSYTPLNGSLVLKHDYEDLEFKRLAGGLCTGLSYQFDKHSSLAAEFSYFFLPETYKYSLNSLALSYTYWF